MHQMSAELNWSEKRWGRPLAGSFAIRGGVNINGQADALVDVTNDIEYVSHATSRCFIGCYASVSPGSMILIR
jgi:hypothetical protein